ncbi:MAG: threonine-phosphate decarboxylase CobD [Alphaproteobacteria bacterium]
MDTAYHPKKGLEHGGALGRAAAVYGRPLDDWIDLSTGINPLAYPVPDLPVDAWTRLPEAEACEAFQQSAADYLKVADPGLITAAPGTQCLIQMLPGLRGASKVAVLSPTYNEHAHVWRSFGHEVVEVADLGHVDDGFDVAVVVNPNNPDGKVYAAADLLRLADQMAARGGWLIVDEAFADVAPEISVASSAGRPGLIVLRSFGKFFGLAGLRLGMILAEKAMLPEFERHLGPWAVPGPSLAVGIQAYMNRDWIAATRRRLTDDRQRLQSILTGSGLAVVGATDLFVLAAADDAADRYHRLAGDGILVRKFSYNENWLRVGLPGPDDHWRRLEKSLGSI